MSEEVVEVVEPVETVEVGIDPQTVSGRIPDRVPKRSSVAVLADEAVAQAAPVVYSFQEQQDPKFQKRLAKESLKAQAAQLAKIEAENEAYMSGGA